MSTIHLATRTGTLCDIRAARPNTTGSPIVLTCKRCRRRMETLNHDGWQEVLERRHEERTRAAVDAVGLTSVLDFLAAQGDSAYVHMASGILGSIAVYLHESGYTAPALDADREAAA